MSGDDSGIGTGTGILSWSVNHASLKLGVWRSVWTFGRFSLTWSWNGRFDCATVCCEYWTDFGGFGCEIGGGFDYDCVDCGSSCSCDYDCVTCAGETCFWI